MRNEWSDPWGWVLAIFTGGLAWAVLPLAPVAGLLVGAAVAAIVMTVKVAAGGALSGKKAIEPSRRRDALPAPAPGSQAADLVRRGERAQARISALSQRPGDPWLRSQIAMVDDGAADVVVSLRDLAGRVSLTEETLRHANPDQVHEEIARQEASLRAAHDPMVRSEGQRALAAAQEQSEVLQRVSSLRKSLLSRMQTAVYGLEALATKMGEVVTMGTESVSSDRAAGMLSSADDDMESLRAGLAEAQRLAREAPELP